MKKIAMMLGVALCLWMGVVTANADITLYVHSTEDWTEVKMHTWSGYDSWNDNASLFTAVPSATNTWVYTVTTNSNISFNGYAYSGALDGTTADHSARGVDVNIGDYTYTNGGTYIICHYYNGSSWVEKVSDISGLTKAGATSFFISGGQTDSAPTSTNGGSNYAYAKNDGTVSVTQNVSDPYSLGDFYKWNIYTDNSGTGGANHFTIVNVATGQFMNIPTSKGQDFTLVDTPSATTLISLYNYNKSGSAGHASGTEAAAGLANANIQNGNNGKGVSNGTKCTTKNNESYTGHFMFTPTELTGLTFHSGPYLIRGLCTINSTVNNTYIYADGTTVKYTETEPSASNTAYMWEIYTVNTPYDGNGGDFAIRNVSTGCCIYVNGTTLGLLPFNSGSNYGKLTIWGYGGDHTPNNGIANSTKVGTSNITNDLHFAIQDYQRTNKAQYSNGNITAANASGAHFVLKETSYPSSGPTAPTNVAAARVSATSVTVSWDEADDADGYKVYKSTDGNSWDSGTSVAGGNVTSYTSTGLTSDIRYYYKVTTIADSDESSASSVVSAVPGTLPSNLAFVAGPFMIRNNYTGFGYQYLYDNTTDNDYTGTEETKNGSDSDGTSYANYGRVLRNVQGADSDATYLTNANYMWDIYSYTIGGNTYYALRNVVTGRFMHTGAYTDYISQWGDNNSINAFAWNTTNVSGATGIDNSNNANKELSYYLYNFKVAAVEGTTPASQADATVNASGFTAQIMTQRWTWGQRSLHGQIGESLVSNNQVYATSNTYGWGTKSWLFTTATRPAPTGLTAVAADASSIDLSWDATEGTLNYVIYRCATENGEYAKIGTSTTNSFTDTGLTAGSTYYYKVEAVTGSSVSTKSTAANATTLGVPAAPTNVVATPDCSADNQITVSWDAVAGAASYSVEAYDNGTARWYDKGTGITATTATVVVAGGYKNYPIRVKAVNSAGSSAWSAEASSTPRAAVPTLAVSTATASSVTLGWTDKAGQTYDVYRSAHADGNYKLLAANQSNGYTDNAVFSGSKYWYKLQITDATCGTTWSNTVNTTTGYTLAAPVATIDSYNATTVTIKWDAIAGAGAYNIYRSVDNVNYDYIGLTQNTTYTDNLNRGNGLKTIYYYKVTAVEDGMEQFFYSGRNDATASAEYAQYVWASGDHIGSWYPDAHEYVYINGQIYYTDSQGTCWTVGGLSSGLAHFRETAVLTGEYKAVVYSAETYNNDKKITFRLATDSTAVLSNATAYSLWKDVDIAPICASCGDNYGWQNYLPYAGSFPMTAGENQLYISPAGSLNFLKIILTAGESDYSLAVAAEYIPQPVRQNPTINSMTSSTINWNAIEGASYKIRFSPNFTRIENTSTNIWGIGQDGEDSNGWITVGTNNYYTLTPMSPTWQYRYEVKAYDPVTGIESTSLSDDGCWVSSRDYAPVLTASASGQTITVDITDDKASEIKEYTLYYSKDRATWTPVTVSKAASSYNLTGDPATLYFFKATATDLATDSVSMFSYEVWAQTDEVTTTLSYSGGTFTWTAVPAATEYKVMRKTSATEYTQVGTTEGTSFTDTTVEGGTAYTYKVIPVSPHSDIFEQWAYGTGSADTLFTERSSIKNWGPDGNSGKYLDGVAYNTGGRYSAGNAGTWMKFTITSTYAANYTVDAYLARERAYQIQNYLSTDGTRSTQITSFEGPNLSGGPNRTGGCYGFGNGWQNYHVYTGNKPVALTGEAQDIYFTNGGINFMKLVFWVNDFVTEGTASNEVEITTPPVITAVDCYGGNSLVISWNYNAEADSFRIYRSNAENGVYTQIARTDGSTKTYTDTDYTFGTTYYYKVSAITGGETPTYAELIAQYSETPTHYVPVIVNGVFNSSGLSGYDPNSKNTSSITIGENAYLKVNNTATNIDYWGNGTWFQINPYSWDAAISRYLVVSARIDENSMSNNAGFYLSVAGSNTSSSDVSNDANLKKISDIVTLNTSKDTWFVIDTEKSSNNYLRLALYDPNQNVAINNMFFAKTAPTLSVAEESDKSAAMAGGCTTMADTIIWTGSAATDAWNDIDNWDIIENGETRAIEASDAFGTPLTVIMPAELGTPTFDGGLGRINAASDIVLAYGALFDMDGFEDASGVCHSLTTSLVVRGEDRGEWILAGPNVKMKDGDGTREQLSGDYYLDKKPWVYMHEINVGEDGENPEITWNHAFPELTKVLTPESAFAIKVEDRYGKYGFPSERYYSKDPVMKYLGQQDVTFTFEGVPYPTPTFNAPTGNWTVITNTTTGNISIADLTNGEGGQVAVWNFNSGSAGNKGSWTTYTNSTPGVDTAFVIPATAFLYYNNSGAAKTADQLLAYTDYTQSGKYHSITASLDSPADPTLTLTAANGKYAAQTSVTYNAFISDEETEEPTNNALKVFSSYDGVPDICSYNGGTAYFSRTVNGSTTTVPLGVSATSDMTFTLTAQGAENFKAAVLDDRLTGLSYNLKTQAALEFDIEAGDNKDRFFLNLEYDDTLQPTTDIDENAADDITVTCNDKRIIIKSAGADLRKVRIADAAGRSTKTDASGRMEIIDMNGYANGVYMVTVWTKNGTKTERIIVK